MLLRSPRRTSQPDPIDDRHGRNHVAHCAANLTRLLLAPDPYDTCEWAAYMADVCAEGRGDADPALRAIAAEIDALHSCTATSAYAIGELVGHWRATALGAVYAAAFLDGMEHRIAHEQAAAAATVPVDQAIQPRRRS